jgi:peptide/nickel transport system substrate-binding protein
LSFQEISRRSFLASLGALTLGSITSCDRTDDSRRLRLAIETVPLTLDPRGPFNADTAHIQQLIFNTLVTKGTRFDLVPELATHWVIDPDFSVHTLSLRHNVRFHNGTELTARDVAYTFESLARGGFGKSANFHALERVETPDIYTVRFVSKKPNPGLLVDFVAVGVIPEGTDATVSPIGTGPFRVATFDRDSDMQLDAFDGYYAGRPTADGIDILVIQDALSREAALDTGEADIAINTGFAPESHARLSAPEAPTRLISSPGGAIQYVALNVEKAPLTSAGTRQALAMGIDRRGIVEALLGGRAQIAVGPLPLTHWAAAPIQPVPFNPDRARALLREANEAAPLSIELLTQTSPADVALATVFQESWKRIGIETRIARTEPAVFFERLRFGDFSAALHRFTGGNQFTTIFKGAFHSRSIHVRNHDEGEINYARFSDSMTDELIDRADVTANPQEQVELYAEIQERIAASHAWIPLWHPDNIAILGSRMGSVELNSGGDFYCLRTGPLTPSRSP